jgi:predicted AAA+ superfamily ATPase
MCQLKPLQVLRRSDNGYPTLCLCDHFIRYAVTGEHIPLVAQELRSRDQAIATQAGHLVESVFGTFFSCLPCDSVATFPSNKANEEVDIVITIKLKKIPIEIKYRNSFSSDDLKGIESFCGKSQYEAPFGIIVTQEKAGMVADKIVAIPAKTMLTLV